MIKINNRKVLIEMSYSNTDDAMFQRAMEFAKNKKPSGGLSNIYVIQKQDINGNVIDEFYGMNLMTDYGMEQYFVNTNKPAFPKSLYIGNGSGSFNHTTNTLLSPIITTSATVKNNTIDYSYPLYYDTDSKLITCVCKYLEAYFDYNITGITDSISVTEYGLGTAYNALWTHSWVYDKTGAKTYITKDVNERLTFTVFMCMSYYESLITDGYKNGVYTVITTMRQFFEDRMWENSVRTYKRYNTGTDRTVTRNSSGFMSNEISRITNISPFVLYNENTKNEGYIDGFCKWTNGFMVLEPQTLETPVPVDIRIFAKDVSKSEGFSDRFGDIDGVPFTQIDVTSSSMFNYKTGEFDNEDEFYNDASHWYSETPMQTYFATPIYYTNNNTKMLMYVYQNVRTDDPIIALNNLDLTAVYATDKYWDVSTWKLVTDFGNISEECRNARYWITPSNTAPLNPIRQSGHFRIIPRCGEIQQLAWTSPRSIYATCDNYEYGWYMKNNTVYVPSETKTYTIGSSGNTANDMMTYDKWLVVYNSGSSYIVSDMSDLSTGPISTTMTPPFTNSTNLLESCYRTESKTGIICLQSLSVDEATIVDLRGDSVTQTLINSKLAVCVGGTKYIAYIPDDEETKLCIYDVDTNTNVSEFNVLTEIAGTVSLMIAHRDYVWITDGSNYTYMIDIRDGSMTECTNTVPVNSGLNVYKITSVDDVLVFYGYNDLRISDICYIEYDKPLIVGNLSEFEEDTGNYDRYRVNVDIRYVEDNTLVLTLSRGYSWSSNYGSYNTIIDFGRYLKTGSVSKIWEYSTSIPNWIPYGEFTIKNDNNMIPTAQFMEHRITGSTNTISTINGIKNIRGKMWTTVITNLQIFEGLPPGVVQ